MRRYRPHLWLLLSALSLPIIAVRPAGAQPAVEQAEQLFREGREAMGRGDYATACPKFAESVQLTRRPGPLLNLAQCEEQQGKLLRALTRWRDGLAMLPPGDERIAVSTERAATLEQRIPRLTVKLRPGAPPGSEITLDGAKINPASIGVAIPLDPGEHLVSLTAPGRIETRSTITLAEKERREVTLGPGAEQQVQPPPSKPASPVRVAEPPSSGGGGRTAGFVVGGIGVASLALGGVMGVLTLLKKNEVDELCPDHDKGCMNSKAFDLAAAGEQFSIVSTVGFGVGGAALVAAIVLFATSSSKKPSPPAVLAPLTLPGGGGFSVEGRF